MAVVLIAARRVVLRQGERTLFLAALCGTGRFALDFVREDTRRLGLTGSQWTASAVVVLAVVMIVVRRRSHDLPREATATPSTPAAATTDHGTGEG